MKITKLQIYIILINVLFSYAEFEIKPKINNKSQFSIPINIKYTLNNISIYHTSRLFNINFPEKNYIHSNYSKSNISLINEASYIKLEYNPINIYLGRNYIQSNNKLLFSDFSQSMDHIKINFKNDKINYNYLIIKLNNSLLENNVDQTNMYINRWYYYRELYLKINTKTTITLSESMISTGENRNIEWYYLTPIGLFLGEQVHNLNREDGNSLLINNDNYFIGAAIQHTFNNNYTLNTSIIIDDFQIDNEDRSIYQDVS